jgi:hypothetical protein
MHSGFARAQHYPCTNKGKCVEIAMGRELGAVDVNEINKHLESHGKELPTDDSEELPEQLSK